MPRAPSPATAFALALVAAAAAVAGCAAPEPDSGRVVSGEVEWARPARDFLQLQIVSPLGLHTIVDFPKDAWYVAALERAVSEGRIPSATVRALETGRFEEVLAIDAEAPESLAAFRLDRVQAAKAERGEAFDAAAIEKEWDGTLTAIERGDAPGVTVLKPGSPVPPPAVPVPKPTRAIDPAPKPPAEPEPPENEAEDAGEAGAGEDDPLADLPVEDPLAEDPLPIDENASTTEPGLPLEPDGVLPEGEADGNGEEDPASNATSEILPDEVPLPGIPGA